MQIYSSEIVRIGEQAKLFLDEGIVVFFGDNAPEELQDFAVIHKLEEITGEIKVGSEVTLSDVQLKVTAVGDVANENFKNLGHLVLLHPFSLILNLKAFEHAMLYFFQLLVGLFD